MTSTNIYSILSSKPHNPHYLKRYWNFIQTRIDKPGYIEKHHICPKAQDLFPEHANESWNFIKLSAREHLIAHVLLWKAFGKSQAMAMHCMLGKFNSDTNKDLIGRIVPLYYKTRYLAKARVESRESGIQAKLASEKLKGRINMWYPNGEFYGRIYMNDPIIQELGLYYKVSDKQKAQQIRRLEKATEAKLGSIVYNNGIIEVKKKAHPGDGWVEGRLPRSIEHDEKQRAATSAAVAGTRTYTDGVRNYRIKPGDYIDPTWTLGMKPRTSKNRKREPKFPLHT